MAHPFPKKKASDRGKGRWNLRIPLELDVWAKTYARGRNTTVTQLIVDYFTGLRKHAEEEHVDQF
jgi:hypothetical protein